MWKLSTYGEYANSVHVQVAAVHNFEYREGVVQLTKKLTCHYFVDQGDCV